MTPPYRAIPLLSNPHAQTLLASALSLPVAPPSAARIVDLPDGDRLALEVSTPAAWRPDARTVVLIHGLCGCARSGYVLRMARKLFRVGLRVVRMNLRGCGAGKGLARQLYHSGRSEDALAVLKSLRAESPASPITMIGFSLGGNIALKLAGELGAGASGSLDCVIAVSPPVDLAASAKRISSRGNRLYDQSFVRLLRKAVAERHALFPDLGLVNLPRRLGLVDFDEVYTAPHCGFRDASDYYARASSAPLLARIEAPCRILVSIDDPMIDSTPLSSGSLPANVEVLRTERGGHLGFLGLPGRPGGFRWMDSVLLEWVCGTRP